MTTYFHRMNDEERIKKFEKEGTPYFYIDGVLYYATLLSDGWDVSCGSVSFSFFVHLGRNCGIGRIKAEVKKQLTKKLYANARYQKLTQEA